MNLPPFLSNLSRRDKIRYLNIAIIVVLGLGIGGYLLYRHSSKADYITTTSNLIDPLAMPSELMVQVTEQGNAPLGELTLDSNQCAKSIGGVEAGNLTVGSYSLYTCSSPDSIEFTRLGYTSYTTSLNYSLLGGEGADFTVPAGANTTLRVFITNGVVKVQEDYSGSWEDITGQTNL